MTNLIETPAPHPQAVVTYPGIQSVIGGSFTWGHGETPGCWVLDIAPQPLPPDEFGSVMLSFNGTTAEFKDCRVVDASFRRDSTGQIVGLTIEDWRWQWRERGTISYRCNERYPDGTISRFPHALQYPSIIAIECFSAMGQYKYGEPGYETLNEFDDARPFIDWDAVNPARALSDLCEMFGCRIAPKFGNLAQVVKLGVGPELNDIDLIDITEKTVSVDKPHALRVVGGPTEFEYDFELEAVALETDGSYVLEDEVSYKPEGGWNTDASDTFDGIADLKARSYAKKSIHRSFRVKLPDDGLHLPGYTDVTSEKIERIEQLIFLNRQCQQVDDGDTKQFLPAMLYGAFEGTLTVDNETYGNTIEEPEPITDLDSDLAKKCIYRGNFSIDGQRGIITTSQPLVNRDPDDGTQGPAKLRLRVAVHVRDKDTGGVVRHYRERNYGYGPVSPPKILRHDEITTRSYPIFNDGDTNFTVASVKVENDEADKQADYYLDAEESTWNISRAAEATYAGIKFWSPDGVTRQVVWTFGHGRPATTKVGHNTEIVKYITPYPERRQNVQVRGLLEDAKFEVWTGSGGASGITTSPASSSPFGGDAPTSPFTIPFRNDSGETIPPYAVMKPDGDTLNRSGNFVLTMVKPDNEFRRRYYVNGPFAIPEDGYGMCSDGSYPTIVRTTEAAGTFYNHRSSFGVQEDSWELKRGGVGRFTMVGSFGVQEIIDGAYPGNAKLFTQTENTTIRVQSTAARTPGASFSFNVVDEDGETGIAVRVHLGIYPPGIGGSPDTYTDIWPDDTQFIASFAGSDAGNEDGGWFAVNGFSRGTPA
jgi:hypothetical protein